VISKFAAIGILNDKTTIDDLTIINNIFVTTSNDSIVTGLTVKNGTFEDNLMWSTTGQFLADWDGKKYLTQADFGAAAQWQHGLFKNPVLHDLGYGPELKDPRMLKSIKAYTPKPNSPVIGAGYSLSNVGFYPGSTDFLGTVLPTSNGAYDIGAVFHQN